MAHLYRVYGHTDVTVILEVQADSEEDAFEQAYQSLNSLHSYAGNGGLDKLVGVSEDNMSVSADSEIDYDDIEILERDVDVESDGDFDDLEMDGPDEDLDEGYDDRDGDMFASDEDAAGADFD